MSVDTTTRLPAPRSNYPLLSLKHHSNSRLEGGGLSSALLALSKRLPRLGKSVSKRSMGEACGDLGSKSVLIKKGKEAWRGGMGEFEGLQQYKKRLERYFSVGRNEEEPSIEKLDVSVSLSTLSVQSFSPPPPRFRPGYKQTASKSLVKAASRRSSNQSSALPAGPYVDLVRSRVLPHSNIMKPKSRGHKMKAASSYPLPSTLLYQQLSLHSSPSPDLLQCLPTLSPISLPLTPRSGLVLVILFDGVLGDLCKVCPYDNSPYQLRLRAKTAEGLKALQVHFRLVLICSLSRKLCHYLIDHFRTCGVRLEACYRLRFPKEDLCRRQFLCYNRLESDLHIDNLGTQALIINALRLSQEDMQSPIDTLICTKRGTKCWVNTEFVPVSIPGKELPISCWVPDIQSRTVPFDSLANVILVHFSIGNTDFSSSFNAISETPILSTSLIHQLFMTQILPSPSAECFREQFSQLQGRSRHERLARRKRPSLQSFVSRILLVNPCESAQPCEVIQTVKSRGLNLW